MSQGYSSRLGRTRLTSFVCLLGLSATLPASGSDPDGFTEPYRTVNVAAAESGLVSALAVREGEAVETGQILGTLNTEILEASLAVAKAQMETRGQLNASLSELKLRMNRLEQLQALQANGHATYQEIQQATAELEVAEARVLSARETLILRKLEYERIQVQIERRKIRSSTSGVVTRIHKVPGEFVAPTDPVVLTVVQLDPLFATFSVSATQARQLQPGMPVQVRFGSARKSASAIVEFVSPVTDAESGTVRTKVRLANSEGRYRSGERCWLLIGTGNPAQLTKRSR